MIDIDKRIETLNNSLSRKIQKLTEEQDRINELLKEDSIVWEASEEKEYCEDLQISKHEYIYFELLVRELDIQSAWELKDRLNSRTLASKFNMYLQIINDAYN